MGAWALRFSKKADKAITQLAKKQRIEAQAITDKLEELAQLEDPRVEGRALTGSLRGLWRYRVGDWRIICDIRNNELVIIVIDVGDRKNIYQRLNR